jgi:hypothetical protein
MKNRKAGFIIPLLIAIVAFLAVGGGIYFYVSKNSDSQTINKNENTIATTSDSVVNTQVDSSTEKKTSTLNPTTLTDAQFIAAGSKDPQAKVVARGDINGDGYEDAIVQEVHCEASCGIDLRVVFNDQNFGAKLFHSTKYETFEPAYMSSSAAKSEITNISIKNGIISLTGKGLACTPPGIEEICTQEKWNVVRTVTYKYDGKDIVQLSVNPPAHSPLISEGKYNFEDSSGTSFNLKIADNNQAHIIVTGRMVYEQYNLYYSTKDTRLNVYFDSLDNTNINANSIAERGGYNKGDEIFVLDKIDDSTYKITWNEPNRWLNNVDTDVDNSFFKKII